MKRLFPLFLAILFIGCEKEALPNVDADIISFNIQEPDVYIYSDLRDPHMGWVGKLNHPDSTYHFTTTSDSVILTINRAYSQVKYLNKSDVIKNGKTITVAKQAHNYFEFRIYN